MPRDESTPDRLSRYRAKRSAERSPEPTGTVPGRDGRVFVVHKHAARQLHFDLRLEMNGVLESWAVPKGPSRNPKEKRLAVKVEDHPIEYADFEDVIPEGNYGAGAMIAWDRGVWIPLADVEEGFEKGKLLFELRGYKLRGTWTLVKIKKSDKDWLLIKERDQLVAEQDDFPEDSILSGLTVEELGQGVDRGAAIRAALVEAGARPGAVRVEEVQPMLAENRERPFSKPEWLFELKYDGYRLLADLEGSEPHLRSRNGRDITRAFPEIARALRHLPFTRVLLDGEVVVHDDAGKPSFQRLQQRGRLSRPLDVQRAAAERPATLYAFDLLAFDDLDVRPVSLAARKEGLRAVLPTVGPLRFADHIAEHGDAFFDEVRKLGLEGIVGKRADSPYRAGRSRQWVKIRADRTDDFVVVGYTRPKGSRSGFGALHLGAYVEGALTYVGRVGTGFAAQQLDDVQKALQTISRTEAPFSPAPTGRDHQWVEPELVCEVRYKEFTDEGLLRHPAFVRFRDDKPPTECVKRPEVSDEGEIPEDAGIVAGAQVRDLQFTNLDKVFWPEEGYTKGDLIEHYRSIAPWMLPYLRDRPLVMTRFPDGIDGKSFFQKDAPDFAPDWLRTVRVRGDESERELRYFVCDDEASLLYIANLATIPVHVWASRVSDLGRPDWCILDLDPKEAPFGHVVEVAQALHRLTDEIALPAFVKTSGSSGLHVLVPLGRQCTHEESRTLGELLARLVVAQLPEIATVARLPAQREGKVYVDFLQNGHGKLLVAPFCVRPIPNASVSMPLAWDEVDAALRLDQHTIRTAPARMKGLGEDPLRPVLDLAPDLAGALLRLQGRLAAPE
jgi:bifunctional non-homologous end joining protein LigD